MEKKEQEILEMLDGKMSEYKTGLKNDVEAATKAFNEKLEALANDMNAKGASLDEINGKVTELQAKAGRMAEPKQSKKSFEEQLHDALTEKSADLKNYGANRNTIQLKAVGNMSSSNTTTSGTQNFVDPSQIGGVGRKPYEISHIRNIVSVSPIATDSAFVIRDAAGEGAPTYVAAAGAKPQSDRDYVKLIQPVSKIAHYFKIPEEMLADISWLTGEISAVGVEELLAVEDDLLLNQAAAAGKFAGLTTVTNSTAYASPASLALLVPTPNNYDVLVAAWTQLRNAKVGATHILCHPSDYAAMILSKATTGEYVFGAPNMSIPNVFGIPLVPHTAITSDKFLMGDFSKARIGQRDNVSVRFYDQNEDDAIKNMVTVVIEERLTVVTGRADYLVYGDFSDARTALTKP
jgi:HK97 family phage major capsid protein